MRIGIHPVALREAKWHEYAIRFFFGGLITVATGLIANKFGPAVGGLFLAFPAIFPATATLIASHEKEKKQCVGLDGTRRGRDAAALESRSFCSYSGATARRPFTRVFGPTRPPKAPTQPVRTSRTTTCSRSPAWP